MANMYIHFSEEIPDLSPQEIEWWQSKIEYSLSQAGTEDENGLVQELAAAVFPKDGNLWISDQGTGEGDIEAVINCVAEWINTFRPDYVFSLEWANTCSKPRPGEFGGGAVIVTRNNTEWFTTGQWISRKVQQHKENN